MLINIDHAFVFVIFVPDPPTGTEIPYVYLLLKDMKHNPTLKRYYVRIFTSCGFKRQGPTGL